MRPLAAITASVTLLCVAAAPGVVFAQQQRRAATPPRHASLAIIRSYDTGSAPVPFAPARPRLRLITDYDAGTPELDGVNLLPAVFISSGRSPIARLGLFTTYDGARAEPLETLASRARSLPIVREYDPPALAPLDLPEIAIAGADPAAVELRAIRVSP